MRKYFLFIILSLLSIGLFSCAEIQPVTIGGVQNAKVKSLSTAGVDFTFDMKIKNPNKMRITVFPTFFDASVNGIDAGKIKIDKKVRIKANSDDIAEFHVKSDFSTLGLANIASVISMVSSKSATVTLKGDVKAGKWYYRKKFPVEFKKQINLSK
jgi:LEA14-like dessication related protein